jgi:DNA-binding MarR family transcriptional regulator
MTTLDVPQTGLAAARLRMALTRLARTLRRESHTKFTASQLSALATIEEFGAMRISTLATYEAMDPSVATRVVAGLESLGLFERTSDPEDKRASLVSLSEHGQAELAALWNERTLELDARLERLSAKDRSCLEAALPALEKLSRDD